MNKETLIKLYEEFMEALGIDLERPGVSIPGTDCYFSHEEIELLRKIRLVRGRLESE